MKNWCWAGPGLAVGLLGWAQPAQAAVVNYTVTLNTASFAADKADQPFSVFFGLDSGGTPGVVNTVTLSNFAFGAGGSAGGNVATMGDASGNLSGSVTLDTDVTGSFDSFQQEFTPGDHLTFTLSTTANGVDPTVNTPDEFDFAVYDSGGLTVATTDPRGSDSLVSITYDAQLDIATFGSDSSRQTSADQTVTFAAPAVTAVPEPGLAVGALACLGLGGRRRSFAKAS